MKMKGTISDGEGKGKKFISIYEYKKQFIEKLNIRPYPGTLNVRVDEKVINDLKRINGIILNGFSKNGVEYGEVLCFPAKVKNEKCFLLFPEKSKYKNILEIIAEENLRRKYGMENGEELKISFLPFIKKCSKLKLYAMPYVGENTSEITIFYDSPFETGRRDLCYFNERVEQNHYKKTITERVVASIIFERNEKDSYKKLLEFIEENSYSAMSPVRKIKYSILNEWCIEVKTTQN
ncbi:MAG TPA: CTP-dependent riboflavin kinase [Thermoplasmatales archaeon]|nr:CTP-dependent riboflavin kinase [Thermoplasmatales archaeon]